jgi:hypothetical protein
VVVTCEIWAISREGAEATLTVHQVYEVREGAIGLVTAYLDRTKALEAAGVANGSG